MKKVCRLIILSLLALTMAFGFTACNDGEKVNDNPYRLTGVNVFDKGCYILGDFETYFETIQAFYGNSIGKITMVTDSQYVTRGKQAIKVEIRGTEIWSGNVKPYICFKTDMQYFQKRVFTDCDYLAIDVYNPTDKDINMYFQINGTASPTETIVLTPGKNEVQIDITGLTYLVELNNVSTLNFIFDRGEAHDFSQVVYIDNFRAHKIVD